MGGRRFLLGLFKHAVRRSEWRSVEGGFAGSPAAFFRPATLGAARGAGDTKGRCAVVSKPKLRLWSALMLGLLGAVLAGATLAAEVSSDALADARAMLAAGDAASALSTLDVYLQAHPGDTDARFVRAVALSRANRTADAIKAFTELAKELPKRAEPYNNLAALYAATGDNLKAHDALQNALLRDPNSLKARVNLGDVYMALAAVEYRRAATLDPKDGTVQQRMAALSRFEAERNGSTAIATQADPLPMAAAAAPVAVPPVTPAAAAPAAVAAKPAAGPAAPAASAPAAAAPVAAGAIAAVDQKSLVAFLQQWVQAGSQGDARKFLALYSQAFTPANGISRGKWLEEVRSYLDEAKRAKSTVSGLRWKPQGRNVLVEFQFEMQDAKGSRRQIKQLEIEPTDKGSWQILRESQTPA